MEEKQLTKLKHNGYIYKVTNITTGQFYIGQRSAYRSGTPEEDLGIRYFTSSKIVAPLFKNNTSEWKKEILYRDINYAEILDYREGYEIHKVFNDKLCLNGYDPTNHGFRTMAGKHRSEETKLKISEGHKGRPFSDEHRRKLSDPRKSKPSQTKGKHLSEEAKRKNSEANKGHKISEEGKKHISEAHKGKHLSDETRRKLSEAAKHKKNNI